MFASIKAKVSGYKTYIVAGIAIASAVVAWSQDQISTWNALQTILAACAACTVRAGIAKVGNDARNAALSQIVTPTGLLDGDRPADPTKTNFHP